MLSARSSETDCEPEINDPIIRPIEAGMARTTRAGDRPARTMHNAPAADLSSGRLPLRLDLHVVLVQVNVVMNLRDP